MQNIRVSRIEISTQASSSYSPSCITDLKGSTRYGAPPFLILIRSTPYKFHNLGERKYKLHPHSNLSFTNLPRFFFIFHSASFFFPLDPDPWQTHVTKNNTEYGINYASSRNVRASPRATIDFPVSIRAYSLARTNNHHQLVKIYRAAASRNEAGRARSIPIVTLHARHARLLLVYAPSIALQTGKFS